MTEKAYAYTVTDERVVERILEDEHAALNHMVLPAGEALPQHITNSNVYMVIVRGAVMLRLGGAEERLYGEGNVVCIPYRTDMAARNAGKCPAELFVLKAPAPGSII